MSETLRVTAAETLRVLAEEAADALAGLTDAPSYNVRGNHDATHRRQDLESTHAVRVVGRAETVLRLVAGLVGEPKPATDSPGTALVPIRDPKGRFAHGQ